MSRSSTPKVVAPSIYAHTTQAQWGRGVISAVLADRSTYFFEHGGQRTFMHGAPAIVEVPLPVEERDALVRALLRRAAPVAPARAKKKKKAEPGAASQLISFERQLELFAALHPEGFADPKFVTDERGTGVDKRHDAAIRVARETLGRQALDGRIAKRAFAEIFAGARRVVAGAKALALPKADVTGFEKTPETSHEAFALALRELLYGEGAYSVRFERLVASLGAPPWTIATVFGALVHPEEHVFVKPTLSVRQAKALGLGEPPLGLPTGTGYAAHLAVGVAARDRLVAEGQAPRDLLDVYTFGWRTLTRTAQSSAAAATPAAE